MPARISIRVTDNIKRREQQIIDTIVTIVPEIVILNAFETREGAILLIENHNHINELLSEPATSQLNNVHLQVTPPQWYYPEKTVFITRVRHDITNLDSEIIVREINRVNNVKAERVAVINNNRRTRYGHPRRKTMKVTFMSKENADHIMLNGLNLFNTRIPVNMISKERYSRVTQCYICFKMDHQTNMCGQETQLCSICGGEHHFRRCPTPNSPTCLNCSGPHIAVSRGCPAYISKMNEALNLRSASSNNANAINNLPNIENTREFPSLPAPQNLPTAVTPTTQQSNAWNRSCDCNLQTTHTLQVQPQPITPEKILENDLKTKAIDSFAKMKSEENADIYMHIINKFLEANDMSPIVVPNLDNLNNSIPEGTDQPQSPSVTVIVPEDTTNPQQSQAVNMTDEDEQVELPFSLHTPPPLSPLAKTPPKAKPTEETQSQLNLVLSPITEVTEPSQQESDKATSPSSSQETRTSTLPTLQSSLAPSPTINIYSQGAIPKVPKVTKTSRKFKSKTCKRRILRSSETETESELDIDVEYDSDTPSESLTNLRGSRRPSNLKQARSLTRQSQIEHTYMLRKAINKAVRTELWNLEHQRNVQNETNDDPGELQIVLSECEATPTGYTSDTLPNLN